MRAWRPFVLAEVARRTGADLLDLRRVRADAVIMPALAALGAAVVSETTAPFIDLHGGADAYQQRFSSNARKQRRRRRRRLEEQGPVIFDWLHPGAEARHEAVAAVRQKRAAFAGGAFSSALDDRFERFFSDVAGGKAGVACRVSRLRCGDGVIAREIGLLANGGYLSHVGTFEGAYARFGPGFIQIDETVAACCSAGVKTFDLLAPSDPYKRELTDVAVGVGDYACALTTRGAIYGRLGMHGARPLLKRLRDQGLRMMRRLSR